MLENIRLSFQGIWSHKMRSFLTMLGIIIGIASLISIVSMIQGSNEQIKQNLIGSGSNTVTISLYQGSSQYDLSWGDIPYGITQFTADQKERILQLDSVEKVSFYMSRSYCSDVASTAKSLEGANLFGVDQDYLSTAGYQVYRGRGFTDEDYEKNQKVVLLDESAVTALFPEEDCLGQTIEIKGEPFTVVGVVKKSSSYEPVINSYSDYQTYMASYESSLIIIPNTCWPIIYQFDEPENCVLTAASTDDMSKAGKAAAEILSESITNTTDNFSYQAEDMLERAKSLQQLSESSNMQLIWIAAISLLVGGIGVMNIMLVSVTERTAEIGLKKAIGARKNVILGQFLTEAAVLTSMGGVLGVIAGLVMANVISKLSGTPVAVNVPSIFIAVGFSMAIGIIFGLLPSIQAANLDPIEALRRD